MFASLIVRALATFGAVVLVDRLVDSAERWASPPLEPYHPPCVLCGDCGRAECGVGACDLCGRALAEGKTDAGTEDQEGA